jgi:hypothetical protein
MHALCCRECGSQEFEQVRYEQVRATVCVYECGTAALVKVQSRETEDGGDEPDTIECADCGVETCIEELITSDAYDQALDNR